MPHVTVVVAQGKDCVAELVRLMRTRMTSWNMADDSRAPDLRASGRRAENESGRRGGDPEAVPAPKQHWGVSPAVPIRWRKAMTVEEALAEVAKVDERLRELERMLRRALRDHPASRAAPLLQQEIADELARKEWLLDQIQRMKKAES
jgi:hypothetical protein